MSIVFIRAVIFPGILCAGLSGAYAQNIAQLGQLAKELEQANQILDESESAPPAAVGRVEKKEEPYRFDADSFIVDRKPETLHKVARVINANTILLESGERVRLKGVSVAEKDAERAYRMMRRMLAGKKVRLEFKRRNRDIHGNLLATVYKGGINVNMLLLKEFRHYTEIDPSFSYSPDYLDSVFPARNRPMNLWELTLGEEGPSEEKIAVIKLKDGPTVEGALVRESDDHLVVRRMYKGLEFIRKKDVEELRFK